MRYLKLIEVRYSTMEKQTLTWAEYDFYLKYILNSRIKFERIESNPPVFDDPSAIAEFQENIISFGMALEERLGELVAGSRIITALESLCENIYLWSYNGEIKTRLQSRERIVSDFEVVLKALRAYRGQTPLAICVIIKNEAKYIEEWLEYHINLGVNKFFVYDNESQDNIQNILQSYVSEKVVEYKVWPGESVQLSAYDDAIACHSHDVGYIGFIDADEFFMPVQGGKLPEIVDDIFCLNPKAGAVGVNWRMYGSSGHLTEPDGLRIQNYLWRAEDSYSGNEHIKPIVNPRLAKGFYYNSHNVELNQGCCCISEKGSPISGPWFWDGTCQKLRINHYLIRSKEEYERKMRRGWPDQPHYVPSDEQIEYLFQKSEKLNFIKDESALCYVEAIKAAIQKRHGQ